MRIGKPDNLTVLTKPFRVQEKAYLIVSIFGGFHFDERGALLDEPGIWEAGASIPKPDFLDALMPKSCGEYLASGRCYSPSGRPVSGAKVHLMVGPLEKTLVVFGRRNWSPGYLTTKMEIHSFTEMDISYDNAFGGPGFRKNPRGKGYPIGRGEGERHDQHLPNVEDPSRLITSPADRPDPAGIGPLGMDWPQRTRYLGTYDRTWLEQRWPWFPDDFDWKYFNAAPQDQWLPGGYFQGDESLTIENMHLQRTRIVSSLPGMRTRCFVCVADKDKDKEQAFVELKTRLDTVWVFPNILKGVLIWRAITETADEEASNISTLVADFEPLSETPRTASFYRDRLNPAAQAEPEPSRGPTETERPVEPISPRMPEERAPVHAGPPAWYKDFERKVAEEETDLLDRLKRGGIEPDTLLARSAPAQVLEEVPEAKPLSLEEALAKVAQSEMEVKEACTKLGLDMEVPLTHPGADVLTKSPPLSGLVKDLEKSGLIDDKTAGAVLESEKEVQEAFGRLTQEYEASRTAAAPQDLEKIKRPEEAPQAGATESFTRERVIEFLSRGESLAGKNLSGLDLSGLDFSGLNLQGVQLEKALLEGCNLSASILTGANFSGAVLAKADLSRARMDSVLLTGANLSLCNAREAELSGSDLREADLTRSDLSGATLAGAAMDHGIFQETSMKGAVLEGASARGSLFEGADLSEVRLLETDLSAADFSGANLDRADFSRCRMPSSTFDGAKGKNVRFTGAALRESRADSATVLQGADFQKADLSGANWNGASLDKAKFGHALLHMTDLSHCSLDSSDFYRADAKQARFTGANLERANLTSINLFRGDLSKARLFETDLKGANLFEVEFLKAVVRKVNLRDANLKRTKLVHWKPNDER